LDLSDSLVSDWDEVHRLVEELHLKVVDLSGNLILPPLAPLHFPSLSYLVLGRMLYCGYSWQTIVCLTQHMPRLTILQVHGNNLTSLGPIPEGALQALEELDLDENRLSCWNELDHLSQLPNLAHLRLNGNQVSAISPLPGTFRALRSLQLSGNKIACFSEIGNLDRLSLLELRMRDNPVNLAARDEETVRQLIVARVSSLTALNGSGVTPTQRKWAEIDYLKSHGAEYLAITDLEEGQQRDTKLTEFDLAHNRYRDIVDKFGEPQRGEGVAVDSSLKSSLLKLKVRSPDLLGSAETVKKVPSSMTVAKLKALLRRVYRAGLPSSAPPYLYLLGQAQGDTELHLDNDLRELGFYSATDGDTILVRWAPLSEPATETDL